MKNALFIINPVSGKIRIKDGLFDATRKFSDRGIIPCIEYSRQRKHAALLAAEGAKSGKYDAIVCCGGDGTLNEVITGLLSSGVDLPLGYVPSGSTNDFAAALHIPQNVVDAAEACASALIREKYFSLDVGKFGDRYFTYIACFGAFAASSYSAPQYLKNSIGHLAYILEGIKDLSSIKPIRVRCRTAEGRTFEGDYLFCGVTNSTSIGGIVKLGTKTVNLDDGQFEVALVRTPKTLTELNTITHALISSNLKCDMIDFFRTSEITFRVPEGTPWTLDGERASGSTVKIENLHRAVKLLKP